MQNTCKHKDCELWELYETKCPNYIVSHWKDEKSSEERRIEDCAPIRTMLMVQELYNRLIGVQSSLESARGVVRGAAAQICSAIISKDNHAELVSAQPDKYIDAGNEGMARQSLDYKKAG